MDYTQVCLKQPSFCYSNVKVEMIQDLSDITGFIIQGMDLKQTLQVFSFSVCGVWYFQLFYFDGIVAAFCRVDGQSPDNSSIVLSKEA